MTEPKGKGRGRPKGTGVDDREALRQMADLIAEQKPKRLSIHKAATIAAASNPKSITQAIASTVRRLSDKYKADQEKLEEAAARRLQGQRLDAVFSRMRKAPARATPRKPEPLTPEMIARAAAEDMAARVRASEADMPRNVVAEYVMNLAGDTLSHRQALWIADSFLGKAYSLTPDKSALETIEAAYVARRRHPAVRH